jgi:hypothetical protein
MLSLWAAMAIARAEFLLRPGLHAQYFTTPDWSGDPARTSIDEDISTAQLSRGWGFTPPDVFSLQWSGHLFIDRSGAYTFATTSDDGSELYLDDQLVVANGGTHGIVTREGHARLERGSHVLLIKYTQSGGPYTLEWSWGPGNTLGETLSPVPSWLLSVPPRGIFTLMMTRAVDWLWPAAGLFSIALAGRLAFLFGYWPRHHDNAASSDPWGNRERKRALACLALFFVLTLVQTWPLATSPAHLTRESSDTQLNEWTLASFAHQLPRHPLQLFEGNTFYPEHRTVAYSEAMWVQCAIAAPMIWLGASPVLAYNLVLFAGFTLTGWAMCLVVARWTNDWVAGLAAGIMMAFNAHVLARLPHLQALHVEFLPLTLLSLDAVLRRPRWSSAVWLAIWFALQALASLYLLVFTAIALVVAICVRPEDWFGRRLIALAPKLALAACIVGVLLAPYLLPYWALHTQGFARSLDEVGFYAARTRDYLTTQSRFDLSAGGDNSLFPGAIALTLAGVAIASRTAFSDARARMCLAFGVCGVLLSFGPAIAPGYEFLYSHVPLIQGIRATVRFGYLGLVAVAVLGGYGVAAIRRTLAPRPAWNAAISVAILSLAFLEPLATPIPYQPFNGIPAIYALPASDPRAIVVEMPFPPPEKIFRNGPYELNSTLNWRPLLNGYSGYTPESYIQHYIAMNGFPERKSIDALRAAGVTDVFVDLDRSTSEDVQAIDREPALRRIATEGSVVLYKLAP